MYTDRDVLRSLTWKEVTKQVKRNQSNMSLVYLAGIFKTNLHRSLAKSINKIKNQGGIICLDHGRLHQGQHTNTRSRALHEALPLVDFYFTTRKELSQYLSLVAKKDGLAEQLQNTNIPLDKIVPIIVKEAEEIFPPVTIIHDNNSKKSKRIVVLRLPDGGFEYTVITAQAVTKQRQSYVGFGNIFQAVFINNLINSSTNEYRKLIPESATLAQKCLEWTCSQLGRTISEAVNQFSQPNVSNFSAANKINTFEHLETIMRERTIMDDLRSICLALNIDFEDLPGEAKGRKIASLLIHLHKKKAISLLLNWFKRNRDDIYKDLDISILEGQ